VPITPEDFEHLDQLHYEGREAVERAVDRLGVERGDDILDIGSGLGGPARWLAHKVGCDVRALELQADLDSAARQLTSACGLDEKVTHICGDILDPACEPGPFDALVSWLVFLHIPNRSALLAGCRERLKLGGGLYAEDFYLRSPLTAKETKLLEEEVYCTSLVDEEQYVSELEASGFEAVQFEDRTEAWHRFVVDRQGSFVENRDQFVRTYNEATYSALASFYRTMVTLFSGGRLGGVVVSARAGPIG
jgi:cyclopropane fatty-acyl-phospholipid synthase-like methyltransferase